MALFSEAPSVGLFLTDDTIYAVEISLGRGGEFRVQAQHQVPTPQTAYAGGAVLDADLLGKSFQELWDGGGFVSRRVVLGLPSALCAWRRMDVPPVPRDEQTVIIRNELQSEGLFDPALHVMDFLPLALPPGEEGVPVTVATAEEMRVHALDEALRQVGIRLEAVEPLVVSAVRLAALGSEPGQVSTVALISHGLADLVIAQGGTVRFQRRIAGEWVPAPSRRLTFLGTEEDAGSDTASMEENAQGLLGEVRRSVVFCQRLSPDLPQPECVYLLDDSPELHEFLVAASAVPSPMDCVRLDQRILERLDPAVAHEMTGPAAGCFLLAMGLALRRISVLADGNQMDLSQTDESLQLARSAPEIRLRALTIGGTWLTVNLGLFLGLANVAGGFDRSLESWKAAADAAASDDPRLVQRDRVERARADAGPKDTAPDRWLDLLGAISTPEIQVTTLQLNQTEVSLAARVGKPEVVLPFTGALERYLPFQGSPTVSVSGQPDGTTSFTLSAKLKGPIQLPGQEPGEKTDRAPEAAYQAEAPIVEVTDAAPR